MRIIRVYSRDWVGPPQAVRRIGVRSFIDTLGVGKKVSGAPGHFRRDHPPVFALHELDGEREQAMILEELLGQVFERGASDLHLSAGLPPIMRVDGNLMRSDHPPLTKEDCQRLIFSMLTNEQRRVQEDVLHAREVAEAERVQRDHRGQLRHRDGEKGGPV